MTTENGNDPRFDLEPAGQPEPADPAEAASAVDVPAAPVAQAPAEPVEQNPADAAEQTVAEAPAQPLSGDRLVAQRRKRGALASGALAMPIITLGATLMAVPLGIWYVSTVFKTIIVVITNMVSGEREAGAVNGALNNVNPGAMSTISLALVIVGAVLVLAAFLISWLMLRAHDVERPLLVTVFSVPMAATVSAVVTASIGALGGLMFRDATQTVAGILGNAALGIAGFAIAAVIVSVLIGGAVWWWVARVLRTHATQPEH